MTSQDGELRVGDHFPRHPKACRVPAEKFFACFSSKGEQRATALEGKAGADKEAGRRGLAECQKEMKAYDGCMAKVVKGKGGGKDWFFRVQDEYRRENLKGGGGRSRVVQHTVEK
ncbi:hypothetical protein NSK_003754 [Nannochloropsis salina CCMP1776]|uniref:Uncharacterized protein n=1 Tax=Nannochloropsis salina CCMP1776 TaxID=1027361 RepID=A0A4D9CZA3_9STRA|nr:hypothetical protein NSK_003754 [Nannochloropsis salina CCMP1776]|eukprot:TFJ84722.1 hypothetical protein NSK_003754 [Nannochloropsis salina CCMP1776]